MPYKDKDRQKQASKERQRRYQIKQRALHLPESVPDVIRERYAKGEPGYMTVIDRLLKHTLDELRELGVWIPCWRYVAV